MALFSPQVSVLKELGWDDSFMVIETIFCHHQCFTSILYHLMWLLEFQSLQLHSRNLEGGKKKERKKKKKRFIPLP